MIATAVGAKSDGRNAGALSCEPMLPDGFAYFPDFISVDEERLLVAVLKKEPFAPLQLRGQRTRRETVSYGREFKPYIAVLPPAPPLPAYLHPLRDLAARAANVQGDKLQQALITKYPPRASIGWHVDHPSFGALIASVSLVASATLFLRRDDDTQRVAIAPRSLYLLRDDARTHYEHKVVADGLRYSITLRTLAAPPDI